MYLLGIDIGSSSVKASIVAGSSGKCAASAYYPKQEMKITALQAGWAEQAPELWWENLKLAIREVMSVSKIEPKNIEAVGISYQMHGLVVVDKNKQVLRSSIIWCDSRAAVYGGKCEKHCIVVAIPDQPVCFRLFFIIAWFHANGPAGYPGNGIADLFA